ncbi:MAG TPA: MBL fold metallo-hydrolase [Casimicrobium sp.]|nr:MBL fold metallo-hydrolase [Casimicrobium sp.]
MISLSLTSRVRHLLVGSLTAVVTTCAFGLDVRFHPVVENVFAFVGETGARTPQNEGLNANVGLVVTPSGAILIDSGATFQSAQKIHEAIKKVSPLPVKWVINTGGQDHRWLGNGYFKGQGAEIIAHSNARADMNNRAADHLQSLRATLNEKVDGTVATFPSRWLTSNDETLTLGGVTLEFKHRNGAHTPGDTMVWLPAKRVLFTGDVVYVDRMLGVLPVSNTKRWLDTFAVIEQLNPTWVVPGHGNVTTVETAKADTQAYLKALRAHMKLAIDDGVDVSDAVKSFDGKKFLRLLNAPDLMPGNASRTYLELERE